MIFVIISWVYISLLIFSPGYALSRFILKLAGSGKVPLPLILINGLLVSSLIALFFGLLFTVGLIAHLFLLLSSILCYYIFRDEIKNIIPQYCAALKNQSWFIWVLFTIFLLVQAYASYMPSSHGDDGLYYSTSIKWVQEYGTVPGLANINSRIGFNSSWLILQALFGFPFLHAGLFNDLNGLLFMYLFLIFLDGVKKCWYGESSYFAFVRVIFFIPVLFLNNTANTDYVFFNFNLFGSSSPDLPACLLTWLVLLLLLEPVQEIPGKIQVNHMMIMLYGVWLLTIKLSAIVIILPMAFVTIRWLRLAEWKTLATAAIFALFMIGLWLARNILLTGYLLYPFPSADWFSFDWKMPMHHVRAHYDEIRIYAIDSSLDFGKPFNQSIIQWFPGWFKRLSFIQTILVVCMGTGITGFVIVFFYRLSEKGIRFLNQNGQSLIAALSCITGIFFWLFNGPDLRFGLGFCLFFVTMCVAWVCQFFFRNNIFMPARIFYGVLTITAIGYYASFLNGIINHFIRLPLKPRVAAHIVDQKDMGHGVKMNLVDYMDSWNTALPCAPALEMSDLDPHLRGTTLKQGFRANQ